ncbi:hypothetical protein NDU88_004300 [Pleurodeles waltl]|uniref:Uncharacterized protein n=1 Tax=Pleurodeles waltl TaxID=8319 RepID=A0AAV7M5Z3_PLEWA|nr:hypothetical protein NDU88_004300 [Pleurodeles waltl]
MLYRARKLQTLYECLHVLLSTPMWMLEPKKKAFREQKISKDAFVVTNKKTPSWQAVVYRPAVKAAAAAGSVFERRRGLEAKEPSKEVYRSPLDSMLRANPQRSIEQTAKSSAEPHFLPIIHR